MGTRKEAPAKGKTFSQSLKIQFCLLSLSCISSTNLGNQLGLCHTKINEILSKIKNIFMDQNFSLNKDTHLCSNFREQASQINFRLSFKRKKEGPKSFDLVELETSIPQCQYSHLSHHMTTDFLERNQEKEGKKKAIPIKSSPISSITAMHVANSLT